MKCSIRANKSLKLFTLCSAIMLLTTSVVAQQCDNENAATVHEVVAKTANKCCLNKTDLRKQKKCINRNKRRRLKRAGRSGLPSEFMELLNTELNAMRASNCIDITVDVACDNTYAATPNEVAQSIEERCCDLSKNKKRKNCLTKSRRRLRRARGFLGRNLVRQVSSEIRTLRRSQSCGRGGERSNCDSFRGTGGGFLHKPVSESTHSVVNLFPVGERPSDCRYENASGEVSSSGFYAGIHNGNRVHIRPTRGGSCGSYPSPLILNCKHGNQRICRRMNNPCARYE